MIIKYKPSFLKQYKNLSSDLKKKVKKRIELLKSDSKNPSLKVHPLKGKMRGFYSFSVTYSFRIVFIYEGKNIIALILFGGHEIYK